MLQSYIGQPATLEDLVGIAKREGKGIRVSIFLEEFRYRWQEENKIPSYSYSIKAGVVPPKISDYSLYLYKVRCDPSSKKQEKQADKQVIEIAEQIRKLGIEPVIGYEDYSIERYYELFIKSEKLSLLRFFQKLCSVHRN